MKTKKNWKQGHNEIVWEWSVSARPRNFRIQGPMINELGKSDFKVSNECF
jgi:hypothetical protein